MLGDMRAKAVSTGITGHYCPGMAESIQTEHLAYWFTNTSQNKNSVKIVRFELILYD